MLAIDGMFIGRGWASEFPYKGLALWDSWVELRLPILQGILAWDFFFDMAGVETTQGLYFRKGNFPAENLRFSLGGGLRSSMQQFPLRFSLAKRFKIVDGEVEWQPGSIFRDPNVPDSGLDPVLSFAIAY
jgi:outer membrane protein insertion porin family